MSNKQQRGDLSKEARPLITIDNSKHRNETWSEKLFESVPVAMVVIDATTGKFIEANTRAEKLFGLTKKKLIDSGPIDISPSLQPDGRASEEVVQEKIQELLSENPEPFEWLHRHRSGRDILCEVRHAKMPTPGRKLYCAMAVDITKRREAENEIRQFKYILESTQNPVGLVDRSLTYRYVNDPYCQAFNKIREEIIGHSVAELFGQRAFETLMEIHYLRCFNGESVHFQEWFEFPGWGRRFIDVCYYPYKDSSGQVAAAVVSAHDITELKDLETKLKESEERFRAFMDHNPAAIYIKDETLKHIYANKFMLELYGIKNQNFIGTSSHDFFPTEIAKDIEKKDRTVLSENTVRVREVKTTGEAGDPRWFSDLKFRIKLGTGKKLLGGIAIDITELKQNEQRLQRAYDEISALKQKIEQENIYLREQLEVKHQNGKIVGESDTIKKMLHQAEQVAKAETTILILGETGTGKELLAHKIHDISHRRNRSMVKVNCAALPANLIESELFGREKGAYTGAMASKSGRFEAAEGSTLFLDEIGDLPLELQSKLLRVLQQGQFERLGSNETLTADVRIIAATNRDLRKAVKQGRFRRDLYYRLNVFPITIPPLRERSEDIPLLTWAFVRQFNKKMGKQISTIKKKYMNRLKVYSWPGNVRELKNIIERSMILTAGHNLHIVEIDPDEYIDSVGLSLNAVEKNHILKVLDSTNWRVRGDGGAAAILGLKPTTLEARMKKLGIHRIK